MGLINSLYISRLRFQCSNFFEWFSGLFTAVTISFFAPYFAVIITLSDGNRKIVGSSGVSIQFQVTDNKRNRIRGERSYPISWRDIALKSQRMQNEGTHIDISKMLFRPVLMNAVRNSVFHVPIKNYLKRTFQVTERIKYALVFPLHSFGSVSLWKWKKNVLKSSSCQYIHVSI